MMTGRFLALELSRALGSWTFLGALGLGIILLGYGLSDYCLGWNGLVYLAPASNPYSCNMYDALIWAQQGPIILLAPLLAAIPFADSYVVERNSGYLRYLLVRSTHRRYFLAKLCTVLLTGGAALALPLVLLFAYTNLVLPRGLPPIELSRFANGAPNGPYAFLYQDHPTLYIGFLISLAFCFGAVYALLSFTIAAFSKNRFVVLATPFVCYHIANLVLALLGLEEWTPPVTFMPNSVTTTSALTVFGELGAIFVVSLLTVSFAILTRSGQEYS